MSTHVDTLPNFKVSDSFIHLFCKLLRAASVPLRTPSLLPHCLSLTVARCLISNLLRTHSPFGNYTLTRHNIRAGWPEKDPERSGDRGRKTVKQRVIMNGCSGGEVTRELNQSLGICKIVMFPVDASQLQSWKCSPGWVEIWTRAKDAWAFCISDSMMLAQKHTLSAFTVYFTGIHISKLGFHPSVIFMFFLNKPISWTNSFIIWSSVLFVIVFLYSWNEVKWLKMVCIWFRVICDGHFLIFVVISNRSENVIDSN